MGRSVSYAQGSIIKAYLDTSYIEDSDDWAVFKDDLKQVLMSRYKSLTPCESQEWLGDEDLALLENDHVYIGISEYCGLTCIWVTPKGEYKYWAEDTQGLAKSWINQIEKGFHKVLNANFGTLNRVGGFSDGTSVYKKVEI